MHGRLTGCSGRVGKCDWRGGEENWNVLVGRKLGEGAVGDLGGEGG